MKIPSFTDVTPVIWDELKANIFKSDGSVLTGNEGVTDIKGVRYSYKYDPSLNSLAICELQDWPVVRNT